MANPIWPLFDLEIRTPRLRLWLPADADLEDLVRLIGEGIHEPDKMPFTGTWTRLESPERERSALQYHWSARSGLTQEKWDLPFAVECDGRLAGTQNLTSADFKVCKSVSTGSWLVQSQQGQGIGKEMRAAVLFFAFDVLGATEATTFAAHWNVQSIGVTKALGYEANGESVSNSEGVSRREFHFRLDRSRWEQTAKDYVPVEVTVPDAALEMLGAH